MMKHLLELLALTIPWLIVIVVGRYGFLNPLFKMVEKFWNRIKESEKKALAVYIGLLFMPFIIAKSFTSNEMQLIIFGGIVGLYTSYLFYKEKIFSN